MKLEDFLAEYDRFPAVILLEGKRQVLEEDKAKLISFGRLIASRTVNLIFRSGNAEGADQWFSQGVVSVYQKRLQVITPYGGHRAKANVAYETISLEQLNLAEEPEIVYYSKGNKKTNTLIDPFVAGKRDRFTIKAAYILRDTVKVLGAAGVPPTAFGVFMMIWSILEREELDIRWMSVIDWVFRG